MRLHEGGSMAVALIWMDSKEAKIFQLDKDRILVEKLAYHGHEHHPESLGKNHPKSQTDEDVFFRQLADKLNQDKFAKILLMGPGGAVKHFEKHLKVHQHLLAETVVGVEKVDRLPDSEILTVGRQFMHKYYLYQGAIA